MTKGQHHREDLRNSRVRILIVCEGKTEYGYFTALKNAAKLKSVTIVKTKGNQTGFNVLLATALRLRQNPQKTFGHTFCVCDHDGRPDWPAACGQMRARAIAPIISIPCFEYWLLLHFTRTDKPFKNCDQTIAELKRHLPSYGKTDTRLYQTLLANLATAKANAATLHSGKDPCSHPAATSYTNLHDLAEFLKNIAS